MPSWGVTTEQDSLASTWGVQPATPPPAGGITIPALGPRAKQDVVQVAKALENVPHFPSAAQLDATLTALGTALEEQHAGHHAPASQGCTVHISEDQLQVLDRHLLQAVEALSPLNSDLAQCRQRYGGADTNLYNVGKQIQCLAVALPIIMDDFNRGIPSAVSALAEMEQVLDGGKHCQCSCSTLPPE
jgi:hypothetical protein